MAPRGIDVEKCRPGLDLPPIAAKADDLEAIKQAVDDAASVSGGLWISYLFVLFYLAGPAGAVTHADLFLENPVKLPFLNVELPCSLSSSWPRFCFCSCTPTRSSTSCF